MSISYSPLSTIDIEKSIRHDKISKGLFLGVFAADTLPNKFKVPAAFIVNTDRSNSSGEHWISIYIDASGIGEYFDSYGLQPIVEEHISFLKRHCKYYSHNKLMLQSLDTSICGHYCCLYVGAKARKLTMGNFVNCFYKHDVYSNDAFTIIAFKKYFTKNSKSSESCCSFSKTLSCTPKRNLTPH